jgi:4a-hydroxytetrahydrobiopterin dehydratase
MTGHRLTAEEITNALSHLSGWTEVEGKLHKKFKFPNFVEAMGWMVRVGIEAEKLGHHPIWTNIYNTVDVDLLTYDLGHVISNLDVALAEKMDELYLAAARTN